ncbi:Hypothetical protein Nlim_0227 [Candidatus Nitrosarchaeum limnium SFB1]|jgi:hypothetical protein|uniref:Uncharacterized protein n=1 Tax=Candidatus Nitrosarchaeum limnium SFB1 TaxID=886738 RepID=F3KID2_9ARCH|nr:Hypothetical protein Nlim_0227 [Candidatus Nitrosarchaeum limnium SFB1]
MKNAQCKKCLRKFNEKDIYTIQQFQYRKKPPYDWTRKFFKTLEIGEWDSFCENCILEYSKISTEAWRND